MRRELAADPAQVERFIREGRAACNIHHPHVIDIFEFGFSDAGWPYLVMDYLDGQNLAEHLVEVGRLELGALLSLFFPLLSAVAAAHDAGILHRDLKPSNIMLARDRAGMLVPKVLDFGTSKLLREDDLALTHSAMVIGTPYYMAPEQARSSRDVDARCDQYALGVMLYECATGARPFEAPSSYELMHAIMTAPITRPSALVPTLSRQFDAVVLRALSRDASERFASVRAFGAALLPFAPAAVRARFAEEFAPAAADGGEELPAADGGGTVASTLPDRPAPRRVPASRMVPIALLLASSVLALATFFAYERRVHSTTAPTAASVPPRAAEPVTARADVQPSSPLPASIDASVARPSPEPDSRPAERERAPRRIHRAADHPRRDPAAPHVAIGDNGAPILE
jgi:serine/threonine-protein kinase